jgi:N-acetyl-gamma-glutamyl-phosphate reductase
MLPARIGAKIRIKKHLGKNESWSNKLHMPNKLGIDMIKVGIVGGTGYTGVELLRLLAPHPQVQLTAITSRKEDGMLVADMFPSLRGRVALAFSAPEKARLTECDVVFFATPHGVAMAQAPELLAAGVKIIDLAADFRLKDPAVFEQWYAMPHSCPELLQEAVYGLPEVNREAIRKARIIGLPGCYPTSMQLGYAPLLTQGKAIVNEAALIADCKSGVSGAGRKAEVSSLLAEAADNFKAYGVKGHRHLPETVQGLEALVGRDSGRKIGLTFVPHLVPMIRGIYSTLYATPLPEARSIDFQALYENHFKNDPFVDVMPAGSLPETRSVRGSNMLRIAVHRPGGGDLLVILVVEDNLVKGAAGQGVQCMNIMFGLDETTGLMHIPVMP